MASSTTIRRLWLPHYVTPSLNKMLGRNHWILTKLKKEARQAVQDALRSPSQGGGQNS